MSIPLPDPTVWRWPSYKLRGVEWRYALHKTKDNAEPLYSDEELRDHAAAVSAADNADIQKLYLHAVEQAAANADEVLRLRAEVARLTQIIDRAWGEA